MIITTYGADGKKERKPTGYGGGLCNTATAPYEAREIKGQTKKTLTDEACLDPVVNETTSEALKIGS